MTARSDKPCAACLLVLSIALTIWSTVVLRWLTSRRDVRGRV